ncbi:hypothetical protein Taro_012314 [Colocasia esculenta]|uniref:Uncharacterized protein n=1 Tax=Colocasia esculenta TaxID=4460 RepID=A0A843UCK2_COLES|nr:hypothetical protein [Colocasia esculenta]
MHQLKSAVECISCSQQSNASVEVSSRICQGIRLLFTQRNHRFIEHSDELRARSSWKTTARANFKHLMYNVRKNAERACASTDKNQWKEHGPESYCRGMDERYGDDSQRPELDPDIWVAASGAPKKGHVYGSGHSLGTTRVISSCSSSV